MNTYPKIPSPFTRNEQTRAWNVGDWSSPEIAVLKDAIWTWTEKLDGTNVRIGWDGERVRIGGRSDNAQMPVPLVEWINATLPADKLRAAFKDCTPESMAVIYGEGIGPKIQKSGELYGPLRVVAFDIRVGRVWCKRETVENLADELGLEVAPLCAVGTINDAIRIVREGQQSYAAHSPREAEGLVGKLEPDLLTRFGERIIVKVKAEDVRRIS